MKFGHDWWLPFKKEDGREAELVHGKEKGGRSRPSHLRQYATYFFAPPN